MKIFLNYNEHGAVSGWASTVTLITLFSGVQMISIGIIGEYIAKIFVEVKRRPFYIVDKKISPSAPRNKKRPVEKSAD